MPREKAGGPLKMCALIDSFLSVKAVSTSPVNWNAHITVGVLMDKALVKRFLKWGKELAQNPSKRDAGVFPLRQVRDCCLSGAARLQLLTLHCFP